MASRYIHEFEPDDTLDTRATYYDLSKMLTKTGIISSILEVRIDNAIDRECGF